MKKVLLTLLVSLIIVIPFSISVETAENQIETRVQNNPDLKITEVYYNTGPGCEFFTIENMDEKVFLGNISVRSTDGYLTLYDIFLYPGENLVIAKDHGYEEVWNRKPDIVWSNESEMIIEGDFDLPDNNGKIIIEKNEEPIDSFYYGDGEDGVLWNGKWVERHWRGEYAKRQERNQEGLDKDNWVSERRWMVGHSDFETEEIEYQGYAQAYVAPDSSLDALLRFINESECSLYLGIYHLTSVVIAEKIANVSHRGVGVKVLAEGVPVGGIPDDMHYTLSLLEQSGAKVRTMGNENYTPYNFFHCKYMIRDNESVLITSENFGNTGHPLDTSGNRGWGVVLEEERVADYFLNVYRSDWYFSEEYDSKENKERPEIDTYEDHYDLRFHENRFSGEFKVKPLLSPDTSMSCDTIIGMVESAEESIYVQQAYIHHWSDKENPYVTALKDAALRGVEVKVLLDSTWYQMEEYGGENDLMVQELNDFAEEKDVSLQARLLSPYKDLLKIHNKGVVVDEEQVMISSINWNANSALQNREVGVIIENQDIGEYYSNVFLWDWTDNIKPIADAGSERRVCLGSEVTLSGENSWDDHEIVKYLWDINGDGTYDRTGKEIQITFDRPGVHEIKLYVEDVGGNKDTTVVEIVVEESSSMSFQSILNWIILLTPLVVVVSFLIKKTWLDSNRF